MTILIRRLNGATEEFLASSLRSRCCSHGRGDAPLDAYVYTFFGRVAIIRLLSGSKKSADRRDCWYDAEGRRLAINAAIPNVRLNLPDADREHIDKIAQNVAAGFEMLRVDFYMAKSGLKIGSSRLTTVQVGCNGIHRRWMRSWASFGTPLLIYRVFLVRSESSGQSVRDDRSCVVHHPGYGASNVRSRNSSPLRPPRLVEQIRHLTTEFIGRPANVRCALLLRSC